MRLGSRQKEGIARSASLTKNADERVESKSLDMSRASRVVHERDLAAVGVTLWWRGQQLI